MDTQARMMAVEIAAAETGSFEQEALDSVIADAYRIGDPQAVLPVLAGAARLASTLGHPDRAETLLDAFLERAAPPGNLGLEVHLALAAGDRARAPQLLAIADRGTPSRWSDASHCAARGAHVGAADVLAAIGARTDEAAARLRGAATFAARGDVVRAAEHAARAAAFYEEVGAPFLCERARNLGAAAVA